MAGWEAFTERWLNPAQALELLTAEPVGNISLAEKRELVSKVLQEAQDILQGTDKSKELRQIVEDRAAQLEEAHRRVRRSVGQPVRGLAVKAHWPPDLLGVLVLQPLRR